ncbi:MAG: hypothetical protein ABUT39_05545 [Acidobacteriota bacterium]
MTPNPPPPPPSPAPTGPASNKMSPLAKVAIGCGIFAVICALVVGAAVSFGVHWFKKKVGDNPTLAVAEAIVRANPELEVVESDPKAGTLTIKNTKTGEVVTMNAKDVEDGKITFTTKEGTTTFDGSKSGEGGEIKVTNEKGEQATFTAGQGAPQNLPSWIPTYSGGEVQGVMDASTAEGRSATFTVSTTDSIDEVANFYESQLKSSGFKVEKGSYEAGGQKTVTLTATGDDKRSANVMVSTGDGKTQAVVNFNEKK